MDSLNDGKGDELFVGDDARYRFPLLIHTSFLIKACRLFRPSIGDAASRCHEHLSQFYPDGCPICE